MGLRVYGLAPPLLGEEEQSEARQVGVLAVVDRGEEAQQVGVDADPDLLAGFASRRVVGGFALVQMPGRQVQYAVAVAPVPWRSSRRISRPRSRIT
ncbi:hypothetical protein HNR25_001995 [Streptomonospora salina]|uniref:Uncharacterized protein n=1 Tax=Streptomonospora salina TaxID=104205 RepID=A0A841E713_9ACTN|nr:hypothetical protein [Streptomonospora salina]